MKVIIISNALTPHQQPLCDAFEAMPNVDISFYEAENIDKSSLPIGWRLLDSKNYIVDYNSLFGNLDYYKQKIIEADAVILGSAPFSLVEERVASNLVTFIYSERVYRNLKSKLKWPYHVWKFNKNYNRNSLYLLCASAFTYSDFLKMGVFKNKAFKWGYFTNIDEKYELEASKQDASSSEITPLMWCARYLSLKHPELPVKLAAKLKKDGYNFILDMFGSGVELENTKRLAKELGVEDCVHFCGTCPNEEIIKEMRSHKIFLFTSDYNEGWGAVANEAMSNGCTLVASDAIGSIPYLVQDGVNGLIFKSCNLESLYKKVSFLLDNEEARFNMSNKALRTMKALWSPKNAANAFIQLVIDLTSDNKISIQKGPCSIAPIYNNHWNK